MGDKGEQGHPGTVLVESWERRGLINSENVMAVSSGDGHTGTARFVEIETELIETEKRYINIIPGFEVCREWESEEVIELEREV